MATAGGVRAGQAYVEMGVNNTGLQRGLLMAQAKLQAFGAGIASIGSKMMTLSAAASLPLVASAMTFANFEKSMSRVKALTGASTEEFAALTKHARFLGDTTEYSSSQVADTMAELAARSFKTNDILKSTAAVMELAAAGGIQLAEAASIAADIMGGMGLKAEEMTGVVDVMAHAISTSATNIPQLGEAFKYIGPSAKSMGVSVEEVTAALMILADAGIKGEMAGTAMRGLFETLKNPGSEEAKKLFQDLGVQIDDGAGKFRKMDEIVGQLVGGLGKLSEVDASTALGVLFPNRQTTAVDILTRTNASGVKGDELLRNTTDRVRKEAPGTGKRISKIQTDNVWGAWKLLESAIEGVAITIGDILKPILRDWGAILTNGVGVINDIIKANAGWIPVLAAVAVGVGAVGAGLVAVGLGASAAGMVVGVLGTAFAFVSGAVGAVGTALAAVFTPIGGIVAGLVAAGAAIYYFGGSEALMKTLKVALAAVALQVGIVAGVAYLNFRLLSEGLSLVWKGLSMLGEAIRPALNAIRQAVNSVFTGIADGVDSLFASVGAVFNDMAGTFNLAWGGILAALKGGNLQAAGAVAMQGFQVVWLQGMNFVKSSWRGVMTWMTNVFHDMNYELFKIFNGVWGWIERTWFDGIDLLSSAWGGLLDFMAKSFNEVTKALQKAWLNVQWNTGQISAKDAAEKGLKIDEATTAANSEVEKNREEAMRKSKDERAALVKARETAVTAEGRSTQKQKDKGKAASTAANDADDRALFRAQIELDSLIAGIAEALKPKKPEAILEAPNELPARIAAVNERVANLGLTGAGKGQTAGTFDANIARFMEGTGNNDIEKQQLKKLDDVIDHLRKIADVIRQNSGGLFFN